MSAIDRFFGNWKVVATILAALIIKGALDNNANVFFIGILGWILCFVVIAITIGQRVDQFLAEHARIKWLAGPGSLLITIAASLFLVGGPMAQAVHDAQSPGDRGDYYSLRSGEQIATYPVDVFSFHSQLEEVYWWEAKNQISVEATARTADGKTVVASLSAEVSIIDGQEGVYYLVKKLGSPYAYERSLEEALKQRLSLVIAGYRLEDLPEPLVLEELVGDISLENLHSQLSGKVVVSDIHFVADSP